MSTTETIIETSIRIMREIRIMGIILVKTRYVAWGKIVMVLQSKMVNIITRR